MNFCVNLNATLVNLCEFERYARVLMETERYARVFGILNRTTAGVMSSRYTSRLLKLAARVGPATVREFVVGRFA